MDSANFVFVTKELLNIRDEKTASTIYHLHMCAALSCAFATAGEATKTEGFGAADSFLQQLTLKVFNPRVVPDRILYGIVYFDVTEPMQIKCITLKGKGKMTKQIQSRKKKQEAMNSECVSVYLLTLLTLVICKFHFSIGYIFSKALVYEKDGDSKRE
ncbi:unnamed protein product [Dibothriocephalus latus]|uniref:Uncharacterized protein n=1 Tax=Dibothriocephalus latus TaxID=60516 RepID=A0A3P7L8Q3_DIBLA|nr:unnamed protein product [Dibothriocephalus latus]